MSPLPKDVESLAASIMRSRQRRLVPGGGSAAGSARGGHPVLWSLVAGADSTPRRAFLFLFRSVGVTFILSNLTDSFTVSLFLALLLSVLLLLFVLTQLLGLDGIFNNSSSSSFNLARPAFILLKAVSDFGAVAAALYYLILYHSKQEGYY